MKKIFFFLIVFIGTNSSPCKKISFLEILGQKDNVLITMKMNFPPQFSFNILEGLCYRTYGSIELENKGNERCKLFFVDLNVNGNFFKCKNTGYSIMRYVDDFLEANQSVSLNVRWDIVNSYNTISAIEIIECPIRIDILGDKVDGIMQINNTRFIDIQ